MSLSNPLAYHHWIGRWSQQVAHEFVTWLAPDPNRHWLDVGCGTGALSAEILTLAAPKAVWGVDLAEDRIAHARQALPKAQFFVGSAQQLPIEEAQVDVAVSGLALNLVPAPKLALTEMLRVTKTGGIVAAYFWDFMADMQLLRYLWNAAIELDPAAARFNQLQKYTMCRPEPLKDLFQDPGLADIVLDSITIPTIFDNFDAYWQPFMQGAGGTQTYIQDMDEDLRSQIQTRLRQTLPIQSNGEIHLIAKAWALKGIKS